ncbi:DUF2442 domain-containing protein [Blastococcus sp. SYSU DS0753]
MHGDGALVDVVGAEIVAGYVLRLEFSTGEVGEVDVEDLLHGPAFEPVRRDYATFAAVRVDADAGTIAWPNSADLSPDALYAKARKVRRC